MLGRMTPRMTLLVKPIGGFISCFNFSDLVSEFPLTYHSELIGKYSASGRRYRFGFTVFIFQVYSLAPAAPLALGPYTKWQVHKPCYTA